MTALREGSYLLKSGIVVTMDAADSVYESGAVLIENGLLAYVGKTSDGKYDPFHWRSALSPQDIELSDDRFLIQYGVAEPTRPPGLRRLRQWWW